MTSVDMSNVGMRTVVMTNALAPYVPGSGKWMTALLFYWIRYVLDDSRQIKNTILGTNILLISKLKLAG